MKTKKVFILDDHPIVRKGLALLINHEPDLHVCGEAGSFYHALEAIPALNPDIVIVDISLEGPNGIEFIKEAKNRYPKLPLLAHSMHDEMRYAWRVLKAGAMGYVMKQEAAETIITAIRHILKGKIYVSDSVSTEFLQSFGQGKVKAQDSSLDDLSDRELEVFVFLGQGYTTRQIAQKLHRSIKTIESYRARIKEKLHLESGIQLVRHAIRWLDPENEVSSVVFSTTK